MAKQIDSCNINISWDAEVGKYVATYEIHRSDSATGIKDSKSVRIDPASITAQEQTDIDDMQAFAQAKADSDEGIS